MEITFFNISVAVVLVAGAAEWGKRVGINALTVRPIISVQGTVTCPCHRGYFPSECIRVGDESCVICFCFWLFYFFFISSYCTASLH